MPNQKIELINAIAVARGTEEPTNKDVLWLDKSLVGGFYNRLKSYNYDNEKWELISRSNSELLSDLKTVDGAGSGLDSDTLQGYTPEQLITSGGSGLPPMSTGKIIVGQGDTIGQAKTLGGIATIDANGSMAYVTNSISHTGLTDIGTNTHVQIDSHIADSAIHLSTAQATKLAGIEAGATTDQTDAEIEAAYNNQVPEVTQSDAEAGTVTTVKRWTPQRVKQAIDALSGGNTIYTANDTIGTGRVATITDVLTLAGGKLALSSTNDGILLNRVNNAQMSGISAATNEIVYNKDLNSLQRYDGAVWVAMAAGYGIIEVKDSVGNPTFYSVFKDAMTAISGNGVITLHSNILIDDASEQSTIAINDTLTINGNGYTITHTCNTGDNFNFINSSSETSQIYLNNVKIVSNGTAAGVFTGEIFGGGSSSSGLIQCSEDTYIQANNNDICSFSKIRGGTLVCSSRHASFAGSIENSKVTTKFTRGNFTNCDIQILTGGKIGSLNTTDIIGNTIKGDTTSNNLIDVASNIKFWDNTIICSTGTDNVIEIDSPSPSTFVNIQNCKIYNYGTGAAILGTYIHSMKDVYIYSSGEGVYTANSFNLLASEYHMENVTIITNSTNKSALRRVDGANDFKMKNVIASCINASNTKEAMNIRVTSALTLFMENCTASVSNSLVDNVILQNNSITTGGAYIYGLTMSKVGAGLNLNSVPLLNVNTIDDFGNLKIG